MSDFLFPSPTVGQQPAGALPSDALPRHVAFIMDGNGRWAQARGVPVVQGHREGGEAVQRCVRAALDHGVEYLTLYAFSSENWRRSGAEIKDLTGLMQFYLRHRLKELDTQNVRLRVIGDPARFGSGFHKELRRAEEKTRHNTRLTLFLALSYGSRAEIAAGVRQLAEKVKAGELEPEAIDEAVISNALQTHNVPDPDLVVRTSGECRLSNFLLWQSAYAELVFLNVLWPDFDERDFAEVMQHYMRRQRRFGGRPT